MLRFGRWWFELGLVLLPEWLKAEVGEDLVSLFDFRQRDAWDREGAWAVARVWLLEGIGLVRVSYRSRVPEAWVRRAQRGEGSGSTSTQQGVSVMAQIASDLSFSFRTFVRRPGLTVLAVFTLALGIGASTAMYSVIQSVLLRPLPYPELERIVSVYPTVPSLQGHPTLGALAERGTWSWPEFFALYEEQESFEFLGAYQNVSMTLSGDSRPERVSITESTHEVLPILGAVPALGRLFGPQDGLEGEPEVVLLTAGYWRDRFSGDPDVVGRSILLDDRPFEVVGVLPDDFRVTGVASEMWRPKNGSPTDDGIGNHGSTRAIGRLGPGVSIDRAREDVGRVFSEVLPETHNEHGISIHFRQSEETRAVRPVLLGLLVAAGLLLVVACGNVAAFLLGAGIERERELAVRRAIGASRTRVFTQLLTESLALASVGAVGGVLVAAGAIRALVFLAPPGVPRIEDATLDLSVLAFATLLGVLCGIGFGSIPALNLSKVDLSQAMGSHRSSGGRRGRLQSMIVAGELALATVLLVGGALLARTVAALDSVDPGFDSESLLVAAIQTPGQRFNEGSEEEQWAALDGYTQEFIDALAALPGVEAVATTSSPPLFGWRGNNNVYPEGWSESDASPVAERRFVSVGFFEALGIPLRSGRGFVRDDEGPDAPNVVVVSEGLADLAWPGQPAVGKMFGYWDREATVIGVAASVRDEAIQDVTELSYYAPQRQVQPMQGPFVVRTAGDPSLIIPAVRDRIWSVDPNVPITRMAVMADLMSEDVAGQRYRARLLSVFALLAGLFSMMGIYGVTARSVARRTQEIGIRVALGAGKAQVRGLVTREALRLAGWGVAAGLLVALGVGGVIEAFLWGVTATDPLTLIVVAMGIPAFAVLAAYHPARTAASVSPTQAMKAE